MSDDAELLRQFIRDHSEAAFRVLVDRRIDLVYAAALRQVGGDIHLAEEVVQSVFLDLSRKARSLADRATLTGWLYTSTYFAAMKALRSRARRMNHETKAHTMQQILSAPPAVEIDWNDLKPVLDAAMHELGERDREAILLRFFEGRSLAEVGGVLGLAENSARMRVDRALEKLRGRLARRGITSTAIALGGALVAQPGISAPLGLAAVVAQTALTGAVAASGTGAALLGTLKFMSMTKITVGTLGIVAALGLSAYLGARYQARIEADSVPTAVRAPGSPTGSVEESLRDENRRLKAQLASLSSTAPAPAPLTPQSTEAMNTLRVLTDLQRRKLVSPGITFVNRDGQLNEAFSELFALAPSEREALQSAVNRARQSLASLERANATVAENEKGEIVVALKPFATEGGAAYDELMKAFADTLGKDRYAAYLALGARQVESALGEFGTVEREVTFSRRPSATGPTYKVMERYKTPDGGNGAKSAEFKKKEELTAFTGTISQLLPPDY